jgi:hypothetical protein
VFGAMLVMCLLLARSGVDETPAAPLPTEAQHLPEPEDVPPPSTSGSNLISGPWGRAIEGDGPV